MNDVIQYVLYIVILIVLDIPLGEYIGKVMNGEKAFLTKILKPLEYLIYRLLNVDEKEEMNWKKYGVSIGVLSGLSIVVLFLILIFQGVLPLNPEKVSGMSWDLALNTAVRFIPMMAALAMAGSLVSKKKIAITAGTLSTSNGMFIGLLIFVVLLIGALSFFPALALGPIAEYLQMIG